MKLKKVLIVSLFVVLSVITVSLCACKKSSNEVTETGTYNCETQPNANKYCKIEVLDANYCRINYLCSENGLEPIDIVKRYRPKSTDKDNKFYFFKSPSGEQICLTLDKYNAVWGDYVKGESVTLYGHKYNRQK